MNRRGFTILEMLIAIGLMAFLGAVSQRLFVASFRTMQAARSADTAITRFDHAMLRLRADSWSSTEFSANGLSATLKQSDRPAITWRFDESGNLSRTDGDSTLTWPDISKGARFSASGPELILTVSDSFNKHSSSIKLISQLQVANSNMISGGAP